MQRRRACAGEDREKENNRLQSEHLRPLYAAFNPELRLRLSARRGQRVDPQRFFGDAITAQSELIGATWAPMPARYETHHTH